MIRKAKIKATSNEMLGTIDGSARSMDTSFAHTSIDRVAKLWILHDTNNYINKMLNRNTYSEWSLVSEGRYMANPSSLTDYP